MGIVLASKNKVQFCNKQCKDKFHKEEDEDIIEPLSLVKSETTEISIKDCITDNSKLKETKNDQFVYKEGDVKSIYTISYSSLTFKSLPTTAIILNDQTSYIELKQIDEKYQRIYLASVVHDIRTPLNGILGMLDMIEEFVIDEKILNFVSVARNSAKVLLYLTYDITDYSQIEAGIITVNRDLFSPKKVIYDCKQILDFNFKRKGVELTSFEDPKIPPRIVSDKMRYMQILLNLLGNALKFTSKGRVSITAEYSFGQDLLTTSVEDTGIGIKQEDIGKLFKMFGKVKDNNELNPTGVGMGLSICKKMSELLGGSIKVQSEYGVGSKFIFTIKCNYNPSDSQSNIPMEIFEERYADDEDVSNPYIFESHSYACLNNKKRDNDIEIKEEEVI